MIKKQTLCENISFSEKQFLIPLPPFPLTVTHLSLLLTFIFQKAFLPKTVVCNSFTTNL